MTDTDRLRRLIAARGEFTTACKSAWLDHNTGDLSESELEATFQAARIKMLRAMMAILPASEEDYDPLFVSEPAAPAVGQRRAAG